MAPAGARSAWVLAFAGSVAAAAADTCSSEAGKAYGRRTVVLTTLRPVAAGTEGGVSLEGTVGGLCGAMTVAAVGSAAGLYGWRAAAVVAVAGLLGSLAESLLGALSGTRSAGGNHML